MPGRAEIARNRNQSLKAPRSGIAERHLEGHVPRHRLGLEIPSWVEKRIQIIYLLALISGTRRAPGPPTRAASGTACRPASAGRRPAQPRCRSCGRTRATDAAPASGRRTGNEGRGPSLQVGAARGLGLVLPGIVRGHVDLDRAARHRQAAAQAGQPFVLAQRLAGLASRRQRCAIFSISRSMPSSASWATPGWSRNAPSARRCRSRSCSSAPLMSVRSQASSRSNKAVTATWCWRKSPSRAKKNSLSNRYSSRR